MALPPSLLISRATVMRAATPNDGYGGTQEIDDASATTIATDIPCRVASPSTRQKFRPDIKSADLDVDIVVVFVDYRTDLKERDRLVVISDPLADEPVSNNYDIQNIKDPGLMHHHLELTAQVIK